MKNGEPNPELHQARSMTEEETIAFLRESGLNPLSPQDWQPHQPLLYVLEEKIRQDNGPFKELSRDRRPNIVRINDPIAVNFDYPITDETEPNRVVYELVNEGGQLDYYAINSETKQIELIKTTVGRIKNFTTTPYHVKKETLFMPADNLFPRTER